MTIAHDNRAINIHGIIVYFRRVGIEANGRWKNGIAASGNDHLCRRKFIRTIGPPQYPHRTRLIVWKNTSSNIHTLFIRCNNVYKGCRRRILCDEGRCISHFFARILIDIIQKHSCRSIINNE